MFNGPTVTTDPRPNVVAISPLQLDADLIGTAAQALRDGLLVAFPTETVYGLGCNALDETAITKVFAAKGRPSSDPLIVHVDGLEMAESVIEGPLPPAAKALADAFWPGPLTMILRRGEAVPLAVTSGLDSVAVRCPSHPVAAALIHEAGIPITAPSANRFNHISPTSAQHVIADLGEHQHIRPELRRGNRLIGALAAAPEGKPRRFERLTLGRHAVDVGDQIHHIAADDCDLAHCYPTLIRLARLMLDVVVLLFK